MLESAPRPAELATIQLSELDGAAELVHRVMPPTPLHAWPKLARRTGCHVQVKHENHTPTGAFKVRGGIVYMNRLSREQPTVPGVISATRGNHGQSIAFAAARAGIAATIYVPEGNSPDQNSAIAAFGASVVEFGKDFDEARYEALRVAAARGLHLVPSFHRDLVLGVGTYALEMFRAADTLDAVYVGVGMGSGICGLIAARDALGLGTEVLSTRLPPRFRSPPGESPLQPPQTPSPMAWPRASPTRRPLPPSAAACRASCRSVKMKSRRRFVFISTTPIKSPRVQAQHRWRRSSGIATACAVSAWDWY
jgi:threonine dehydratase